MTIMNNFKRYYEAVNFLEGLSNLPIEGDYMINGRNLGVYLKRMRYFLNMVGNPDRAFKFIHITGTSGKGSVTNMTHEILHAAGKNVGSFTSPFVTTSIEKIKVGEKYVDPDEFADIVDYLKLFIDKAYIECPYGRPSYFELFFAIALIYFKQKKCKWVVLEVGCGGRYDATNVIEKPVITAITNIDYDHTQLLGKTLKKIALDKAGIIKEGSMFFTSEHRPALVKIFADICRDKKVAMVGVPSYDNYHQANVALVTAITKRLGVDDVNIQKGIRTAHLQCRFETMQYNPRVILDGAHNRSKIRTTLENLRNIKFRKSYLIIGIAENKDSIAILEQIIPLADYVIVTRFQIKDRKCAQPKELLEKSKKYLKSGATMEIFLDSKMALSKVLEKSHKEDLILVAGSFFLAGELRKKWFSEEWILRRRKM